VARYAPVLLLTLVAIGQLIAGLVDRGLLPAPRVRWVEIAVFIAAWALTFVIGLRSRPREPAPSVPDDGEPLEPGEPSVIGGRFRVRRRLGVGSQATVYLATDRDGRLYAVKVILAATLSDPATRKRVTREADALGGIDSPQVVRLVASDLDSRSQPWVAMTYIGGQSLETAAAHGQPAATVGSYARDIAYGLRAIHEAGVVHRDIKPANIVVVDGRATIIDFGIATTAGASYLTRVGSLVGTPAFMSPEQTRGSTVGPASDVFSLGSVIVYAATGRAPFDGTTDLDVYEAIREGRSNVDRIADPALRAIAARCLRSSPEDRPSAAEVAQELDDFVRDQPAPAVLAATILRRPTSDGTEQPTVRLAPEFSFVRHSVLVTVASLLSVGAVVATPASPAPHAHIAAAPPSASAGSVGPAVSSPPPPSPSPSPRTPTPSTATPSTATPSPSRSAGGAPGTSGPGGSGPSTKPPTVTPSPPKPSPTPKPKPHCTSNDGISQDSTTGTTFFITISVKCAPPSNATQYLVAQQHNPGAATYCLITQDVIPRTVASQTYSSNLSGSPVGSVRDYYVIEATQAQLDAIKASGTSNGCYLGLEGTPVVSNSITHTR
jgi:serine/threonine protein kinase